MTSAATGSSISYNRIGTDVTGETLLGSNGNTGISIQYTSDISVYHNVLGGHNTGIECFYSDRTAISNNYVGISVSGTPLPNSVGIHVYQSNFTEIGINGGNIIARNSNAGIQMDGASIRNPIRFNWIHHNGTIGIDLAGSAGFGFDGVTSNDSGDSDSGPNLLQNYPVLTNVSSVGGQTTITGTINTTANQLVTIDFYGSGQCSSSGHGEGELVLGSASVQTNSSGNGTFTATLATPLTTGSVVSATATDPYGNTSEFSACSTVQGAGTFTFNNFPPFVDEGSAGVIMSVFRTNGTAGPASVNYATANGTATAGSDYTATSGTLTFADGETSKSFTVPMIERHDLRRNRDVHGDAERCHERNIPRQAIPTTSHHHRQRTAAAALHRRHFAHRGKQRYVEHDVHRHAHRRHNGPRNGAVHHLIQLRAVRRRLSTGQRHADIQRRRDAEDNQRSDHRRHRRRSRRNILRMHLLNANNASINRSTGYRHDHQRRPRSHGHSLGRNDRRGKQRHHQRGDHSDGKPAVLW